MRWVHVVIVVLVVLLCAQGVADAKKGHRHKHRHKHPTTTVPTQPPAPQWCPRASYEAALDPGEPDNLPDTPTVNFIAFGDSIAYNWEQGEQFWAGGLGGDQIWPYTDYTSHVNYNQRIRNWLERQTGERVGYHNFAVPGATGSDGLMWKDGAPYYWPQKSIMRQLEAHPDEIAEADYITLDAGANDMWASRWWYTINECGPNHTDCLGYNWTYFEAGWEKELDFIAAHKKPSAKVSVMGHYYPYVFPDWTTSTYGGAADYSVLAPWLANYVSYAKNYASAKGFNYVNLVPFFNGASMYSLPMDPRYTDMTYCRDPLHPNPLGDKRIAELHEQYFAT